MSLLTSLSRMWLTRALRPFDFRADYDEQLLFQDCESLGLYVHIPFCRKLCSFCPYCKEQYTAERCERYIDHLLEEIHLVGRQAQEKKRVTSLYFGGGSPALAAARIGEIVEALEQYFIITEGIGLELHPADVQVETLEILKRAGVTKISIGIQSFGDKYLQILGRAPLDIAAMAKALAQVPFETVSMDFIFALPQQSFADLRADIETAFAQGANHIAIYPFINFSFAEAGIAPMKKREKRRLLDAITQFCHESGYVRDSIWTFSKEEGARYSSMTRDTFLGFGCSATTLLSGQFKVNTFSVEAYQERIAAGKLASSLTLRFTRRQRMLYYLFWTAYSTKVDPEAFAQFFGTPLRRMYGFEFWLAKRMGFLSEQDGCYVMSEKGAFYYHYYENYYTLAYIDKMWGLMREQAFPKGLQL